MINHLKQDIVVLDKSCYKITSTYSELKTIPNLKKR